MRRNLPKPIGILYDAGMWRRVYVLAVALVAGLFSVAAMGQVYRCQQADGRVAFQDAPCAGTVGQQLPTRSPNAVGPSADRPEHIRAGLAAKRAVPGMTEAEVVRALGAPLRRTSTLSGSTMIEQMTFRAERAIYGVTLTNGVVSGVTETPVAAPSSPGTTMVPSYTAPSRQCPTPREIRDIEVELSKIENRDKPRVLAELQRQLSQARSCR